MKSREIVRTWIVIALCIVLAAFLIIVITPRPLSIENGLPWPLPTLGELRTTDWVTELYGNDEQQKTFILGSIRLDYKSITGDEVDAIVRWTCSSACEFREHETQLKFIAGDVKETMEPALISYVRSLNARDTNPASIY